MLTSGPRFGQGVNEPDGDHLQRVRAIVLRYGWNATAYQIINPGIRHWFSSAHEAVVGYVEHGRVRVTAGAPVCVENELAEVAAEFERDAARCGKRVCYFGAETRLESVFRAQSSHSMVLLGAQPVWRPQSWPAVLEGHSSLRAQLNRARNKGVRVEEWPATRASGDPQLQRCLQAWLATRGLPPMHFLVEPETLARLFDRRVLVAEREGEVVAFLVASPVPCRKGWLIEQIVRGRGAANGTAELLIDAVVRVVAAEGSEYITLGLSPLSQRAGVKPEANPLWLRIALWWARVHGRRFYNFEGLDAFKAKFHPEAWEPVYAVANTRRFTPRMLYAIGAAFSNGTPLAMVGSGLARAVKREGAWLWNRLRPSGRKA